MRTNLRKPVNLDFLDGYLFHFVQKIAAEKGLEESGLTSYYGSHLTNKIGGLLEYECALANYLLIRKPPRVVHAGIGIGPLACALACNGIAVVGIEAYPPRAATARLLKADLGAIWPDIQYDVIEGFFPDVLGVEAYEDSVLVFTNVAAGWDDAALDRIIKSTARFSEAIVDLQVFGALRQDEGERAALFERIAKSVRFAERLPHVGPHVARFAT